MVQVRLEINQEEIQEFQKRYVKARNKRSQVALRLCERDWVVREIIRTLDEQNFASVRPDPVRDAWTTAGYTKRGRWGINRTFEPCVWRALLKAVPQYEKEVQQETQQIEEARKAAEEKRLREKAELAAKLSALPTEIKKVCTELEPYHEQARLEIAGKWDSLPIEFRRLVITLCSKSCQPGTSEYNSYNNHVGWIRKQIRFLGTSFRTIDSNSVAYKSLEAFVNGSSYVAPTTRPTAAPTTRSTSALATSAVSRFDPE